jgi:hypothetical protein
MFSYRSMKAAFVAALLALAIAGQALPAGGADAPAGDQTADRPAEASGWLDAEAWAEDLAILDSTVREQHPNPFARTPESVWNRRIAEAAATLPSMDQTSATAEMVRLVSLLDMHSGIFPDEVGFQFYCEHAWTVMADGVYVTAAVDPTHVGARILAIGDEPMDLALARLRPYINADNESSMTNQLSWMSQTAELLRAAGVIDDITQPDIVLRLRDGTTETVQLAPTAVDGCGAFDLADTAPDVTIPDSASRRGEPVWWEVDPDHRAFILAYNQPGTATDDALDAMKAALDASEVDRVVVDLRYAPGGAYHPSLPLVEALAAEPRVNQPGRLAVLTSRETFSATNALVSSFEQDTEATFIGEPTPGRPNPFLDEITFTLPNSGLVVHVPTTEPQIAAPDDQRDAIYPDVAVPLLSSDWFTGRDPALEVAMSLP